MNKQELIKHFEEMEYVSIVQMGKKAFIDMIEQLDEPQKPVVPQFVADWYEEHKDDFEIALFRCIDHIPSVYDEGDLNEFEEWIIDGETKPFQTLVNMHQFGYEVEQEKRYRVKVKGVSGDARYLNREVDGDWYINNKQETHHFKVLHTRKELEEANFGWVFNCPGIEVEEVEE